MSQTQTFRKSIMDAADELKIPAKWLHDLITLESNHNPNAVNSIGAVGLIQFTRTTMRELKTTTAEVLASGYDGQVKLAVRYFQNWFRRLGRPADFYDFCCMCFYPRWVGKATNAKLPKSAYNGNKGLDRNRDGEITKAEYIGWINRRLGLVAPVRPQRAPDGVPPKGLVLLILAAISLWLVS